MKQMITLLLALCVSLSLVACDVEVPQPVQISSGPVTEPQESIGTAQIETQETTDATYIEITVPETTAQQEITFEQFLDMIMGVWVFDETVERRSEDLIVFDLIVFKETACTTGFYPGELDRSGYYEGFAQIDENTYQVELLYQAGMHMGNDYEETRSTLTLVCLENGEMQAKFDDGKYYTMTYGGDTYDAAAEVAFNMVT